MTCHPSDNVGLTEEIASEIWFKAKTIVGLDQNISLATPQNILIEAKKVFAEIAFGHPHYASHKEICFYTGLNHTTVTNLKLEWLRKQRSERRQITWQFKSIRSKFGEPNQN